MNGRSEELSALQEAAAVEFRQESARLRKMLPSVASLGSNPEDILSAIRPTKEKIGALLTEIDESAKRMKAGRPKLKGKTAEGLFQEMHEAATPGLQNEMKDCLMSQLTFDAWREYTGKISDLKEECEARMKEVEAAADKARESVEAFRIQKRYAALKKTTVEEVGTVSMTGVEIKLEEAALFFAPVNISRRFEKAHGVLIDDSHMAKGKGKGKGKGDSKGAQAPSGPPKANVSGTPADVAACVKAIKAMNLSGSTTVSTKDRRAGSVIGKGAENMKKVEEQFGVYIELGAQGANEINVYGDPKKVEAAVKEIRNRLDNASSEAKVSVDVDMSRVIIGEGGRNIRNLESDTGTKVNVGKGDEKVDVTIKGSKDSVAAAKAKIEAFIGEIDSRFIEVEASALSRLYAQSGKGGKGGKGE